MSVIVLIVDDDESVRFFHQIVIAQSQLSAEPLSFESATDVLDYLDQNNTEANTYLILLDINMPGMSGWDLMEIMSEKTYRDHICVVIVTSSVDRADHEKAKLYDSIIDFAEKPISQEAYKKIMNFPFVARNL